MGVLKLALGLLTTGVQGSSIILRHASSLILNELGADKLNASLKVLTKDEIMAKLTDQMALDIVLHDRRINEHPKLVALLQNELAQYIRGSNGTELKNVQHHLHGDGSLLQQAPNGPESLNGARTMLNEMMDDSMAKLDNEVQTCSVYSRETLALLEQIRQDVASFNAASAEARSRVLKNQGIIAFTNLKMPQVEDELDEHNKECTVQESDLNAQIEIVAADLAVMGGILDIIGTCDEAGAAALVQCRHCRQTGEGYVMMQHDTLQPLLNKLKSAKAKMYVQANLGELYHQLAVDTEPVALTQEQAHRQLMLMMGGVSSDRQLRGRQNPSDPEMIASMGNETLNMSAAPQVSAPADCVPTTKCTMGKGNCVKIRDRFLQIQAGIQDMLDGLKSQLTTLLRTCHEDRTIMEAQIADLGDKMRVSQTELAIATKDQVDAESSSNLKAQQHKEVSDEHGQKMKECCEEQNDLKSEICSLVKIRGELYKMRGFKMFITDCEVTDFKESACSVSCGGGTLVKKRTVLVHPVNGMACPPLELKESCNTHPCPIDCLVGEWEGWSSCSAECGGGVRSRIRPTTREMKYGGVPCDDTEETEGCNSQSCNKNCELGPWTEWSACSQACWKGSNSRSKSVQEAAAGTGSCPEADSPSRLEFRDCNDKLCKEFYHDVKGQEYLKCGSKTDMIILMDGSGSLGETGWQQSKKFVQDLISNLKGGDDFVKVALLLFSGPVDQKAYKRCTGQVNDAPDMEKDCKITWVQHLTNNTLDVIKAVDTMKFPRGTTLTSVALAEAETELMNGREDATSVVVVVTDGLPLSPARTTASANKLMSKARIVWVPVGPEAPYDLVQQLASLPKTENIIAIDDFKKLSWNYFVNKLIAHTCPVLDKPQAMSEAMSEPQLAP